MQHDTPPIGTFLGEHQRMNTGQPNKTSANLTISNGIKTQAADSIELEGGGDDDDFKAFQPK